MRESSQLSAGRGSEPFFGEKRREFRAAAQAELTVDMTQVGLNCFLAQEERGSCFAIGGTIGHG